MLPWRRSSAPSLTLSGAGTRKVAATAPATARHTGGGRRQRCRTRHHAPRVRTSMVRFPTGSSRSTETVVSRPSSLQPLRPSSYSAVRATTSGPSSTFTRGSPVPQSSWATVTSRVVLSDEPTTDVIPRTCQFGTTNHQIATRTGIASNTPTSSQLRALRLTQRPSIGRGPGARTGPCRFDGRPRRRGSDCAPMPGVQRRRHAELEIARGACRSEAAPERTGSRHFGAPVPSGIGGGPLPSHRYATSVDFEPCRAAAGRGL